MRRSRAVAIVVALALVGVVPLVLGDPAALLAILPERVAPTTFGPPPLVTIASPSDGDGVQTTTILAGVARASNAMGVVTDVQARVDGGSWTSIASARGAPTAPFELPLQLAPGDHVLEARAFDGAAFSPVARVVVRAGAVPPPTVRILQPIDGQGLASGAVQVRGTVASAGSPIVLVRSGDQVVHARIVSAGMGGALWDAQLVLPSGVHAIDARAEGGGGSVPRRVVVALDATPPPTLQVLRPSNGSAFGTAGGEECDGPCILFAGAVTQGASLVRASLDGAAPVPATLNGDAWSWRLDVSGMFDGEHTARFVASAPGSESVPRDVTFTLRTPRHLDVVGDAAPRPTGTPLQFSVRAPGEHEVAWALDEAAVGDQPTLHVTLARPGDHVLAARITDPEGHGAVVRLPLYAINRAPSVVASVVPADAGERSLLTAAGLDPDGTILGYAWEFGDGDTLTTSGGAVEHAYQRPGSYVANVTVVDDAGGASAPDEVRFVVRDAPPVASFSWEPETPSIFDDVSFRDASFDPNGAVASWAWDLGDGNASTQADPVHRFAARGDVPITLSIVDGDGSAATLTRTLHVRNLAPEPAFLTAPAAPVTGQVITFTDASVKTDGAVASWAWDFGDGLQGTGASIGHAYGAPGRYRVALSVVDDMGARAATSGVVVVSDDAPRLRPIVADPPFPHARDAVRFTADASDIEGPPSLAWDFGDGVVSLEPSPAHRYARSGDYVVTAAATDAAGQTTLQTLTLHVANAPPTVAFTSVEGAYAAFPTTVRVLAEDVDGHVKDLAFDVDSDGSPDCEGDAPLCTWTFPSAGVYVARVRVTDDEGAMSEATRVLDILPPPQGLAPPVVRIAAPLQGEAVKGAILVQGTAAGASPIRLVELQIRDSAYALGSVRGPWQEARGTDDWTFPLDTRVYPDGAFDIVVRATDTRGNANESHVRVQVDNAQRRTDMTLRILDLRPEQTIDADANVRGSAYHPQGVSGVRWRVDDGAWKAIQGNLVAWAVPLRLRDLAPGTHTLEVEAYHGVSERANVSVPFRVGDAAPFLYVEQAPAPVAYGVLHAEGRSRADVVVLWRLDNGVWRAAEGNASWVLNVPTGAMEPGPRTVTLKATSVTTGLESDPITFPVRIMNTRSSVQTAAPTKEPTRATPPVPLAFLLVAAAAVAAARRRAR